MILDKPKARWALLNVALALWLSIIGWHEHLHGQEMFYTAVAVFVLFNAIWAVALAFQRKRPAEKPNPFIKPAWIAVGILFLIYLIDYIHPF